MPHLVIDASAALFMAIAVRPTRLDTFELVAPDLFLSERTSALVAGAFRTEIPHAALIAAFERLESLPVRIVASDRAHRLASVELARSLGWAKTYDAEYVAVAQRLGCPMLTTDVRLVRGAGHLIEMVDPRTLQPS